MSHNENAQTVLRVVMTTAGHVTRQPIVVLESGSFNRRQMLTMLCATVPQPCLSYETRESVCALLPQYGRVETSHYDNTQHIAIELMC